MTRKRIDILHITIDYNENLGAYYFLQKLEKGLLEYNVYQRVLIMGCRKNDTDIPENVLFYEDIDVLDFFAQINKKTILIFHESFATYARKDMQFPVDLYDMSRGFTRMRMIHDYSTAVCPMALDIEKYILCKGVLREECIHKGCIDKEVYDSFINSMDSLRQYNGIMCLSKNTINKISIYGIDESKVFQIPPLIEGGEKFQKKTSPKRILYASRICEQKGLMYLVKALCRIKEYDWELYIAGAPEEKGYYLQVFRLIRRENIMRRVKILGHLSQDQLKKARYEADIFCFPSIGSETYGFSGAEAVLSGMPVIAFDIDGVNEWLVDGKTGYICRHLDVDDMASKIKELLINGDLYKSMRENCVSAAKHNDFQGQLQRIYYFFSRYV